MNFWLSTSVSMKLPVRPEIATLTSPTIIPSKATPQGSALIPGLSLRSLTAALECLLYTIAKDLKLKIFPIIVDSVSFQMINRSRRRSWMQMTRATTGGTCPRRWRRERVGGCVRPDPASVVHLRRKSVRGSELACSVCSLFSYHQWRCAKLWKRWLLRWVTFSFPWSCSPYRQPPPPFQTYTASAVPFIATFRLKGAKQTIISLW